jgi:thioredoxin reductase (NADPH)
METDMRDVIIVGGSFAGHAAALMLGRARRDVLLLDAGAPRNRFAETSHGFLGQDGQAPGEIMRIARGQLAAYGTVEQRAGLAVRAVAEGAGFRLVMEDGREEVARRLVLATGQRDVLPDLPGLADRWGKSVLHCPYCHGYELNQGPIGVLAAGEMSMHHALMLPDWGPTTLFLQGAFVPNAEQQAALAARGVAVEPVPVMALEGDGASVRLADGRLVALAGLFIAARTELASDLAMQLGCAMAEGPLGDFVVTDERKATTVPGVFAAGDLAAAMANATLAAAAGMMAGVGAHQSLLAG